MIFGQPNRRTNRATAEASFVTAFNVSVHPTAPRVAGPIPACVFIAHSEAHRTTAGKTASDRNSGNWIDAGNRASATAPTVRPDLQANVPLGVTGRRDARFEKEVRDGVLQAEARGMQVHGGVREGGDEQPAGAVGVVREGDGEQLPGLPLQSVEDAFAEAVGMRGHGVPVLAGGVQGGREGGEAAGMRISGHGALDANKKKRIAIVFFLVFCADGSSAGGWRRGKTRTRFCATLPGGRFSAFVRPCWLTAYTPRGVPGGSRLVSVGETEEAA